MKVTISLLAIFLSLTLSLQAYAEGPTISTDRESYNIGDLITLTIELEGKGYKLNPIDKASLAPFEMTSKEEIFDETAGKTRLIIKGSIFETGDFSIPSFKISDSRGNERKTSPVALKVLTLLENNNNSIRDIKPQVEVNERGALWPWIVIAIILAALAVLIFYLMRKRKKVVKEEEVILEVPAHIEALNELAKIEALELIKRNKIKEFYILISDVIRTFEGRIHGIDAMEMTTSELMDLLEQKRYNGSVKLERFLNDCDMVKFADYTPPQIDTDILIGRARGIVKDDTPKEASEPHSDHVTNLQDNKNPKKRDRVSG